MNCIITNLMEEKSVAEILYSSTRGDKTKVTASQAILRGLAADGGLFVPDHIPHLEKSLSEISKMDYKDTAYEVMKLLLSDYTEEELRYCIDHAYDSKFDTEEMAPMTEAGGAYYLELYHGKTIAFKDMALSILPYLMTTAAKKNNIKNEIVILTATSGDTGKAALAGFADVPGTRIVVFYPKHGVSPIQERQMVTQEGDNTCVVGIEGNFDDAQTGVKKIFTDPAFAKELDEKGFQFSSANSINIGRLVPQIVYYVYSYTRLLKEGRIAEGDEINVVVPTGNFGNILAAYYAGKMGTPIKTFICASNSNKVLYDFFGTGTYDRNRDFVVTSSPSMDILISSNLERLIYHIAGDDASVDAAYMKKLSEEGKYEITPAMREKLSCFYGGYATEDETKEAIRTLFDNTGYLIDTHTAVASSVYSKYVKDTNDKTVTVIASTASPYKFTRSVMEALSQGDDSVDDFVLADRLCKVSGVEIPEAVTSIRDAKIRHDKVVEKDALADAVREFLFK